MFLILNRINDIKNVIVDHEGSIQNIPGIPVEIKNLYKTVWEVKMKNIIALTMLIASAQSV